MNDPSERKLVDELAARFRIDVDRARNDLEGMPVIERRRGSLSTTPLVGLALTAVALVGLVGGQLLVGRGLVLNDATAVPTAPLIAGGLTPAPGSTVHPETKEPAASFELVDRLPTKIDGVEVLRGEAALAAIRVAAPGDRLLIGGWLVGATPMSCPALQADEWWNPCLAVGLHETAFNGPITFIYRGSEPVPTPLAPAGQTGPIVLSVHTHDASCAAREACDGLPVIDELVWFGGLAPVPSNFGPAPSAGVSRDEAISQARAYAAAQADGSVELVSATAAAYGTVRPNGSEISADHWVWSIVFAGRFSSSGCGTDPCTAHPTIMIILDYATGDLIVEEMPA